MFTETKPPKIGGFIICLMVALVTRGQSLQIVMEITPDSVYCGHLQCWADKNFTYDNILTVVSLTVYDIKQSNSPVKVVSVSMFDPDVYVDKTNSNVVNVTGNITNYHAELALSLRDTSYCLTGTFSCELDFVSLNGQTQILRETVSPENRGSCSIFGQFAKGVFITKAHFNEIEKENVQRGKEIVELEKENVKLRQENLALKTEVSRLVVNSSLDKSQVACYRGMLHYNSREHFLLWDKMEALCDTETDGGGWIVIQRRRKGDVDFYRGWADYKNGFGTLDTDFWIGNDNIHNLTSQGYTELRIDMEYNGTLHYAHYSHFNITDENSNYRLSLSGFNGTVGDGMSGHSGVEFSTYDKNHTSDVNCAFAYHGAWWYFDNGCYNSNLNGLWGATDNTGLVWFSPDIHLSFSEMKIRHV